MNTVNDPFSTLLARKRKCFVQDISRVNNRIKCMQLNNQKRKRLKKFICVQWRAFYFYFFIFFAIYQNAFKNILSYFRQVVYDTTFIDKAHNLFASLVHHSFPAVSLIRARSPTS